MYYNGYGGFDPEQNDYVLDTSDGKKTPLPWSYLLVNDRFGALFTAQGGGYLWFSNSQMGKLTPWFNDPQRDPPGHFFVLRDVASSQVYAPYDYPWLAPGARQVRYALGSVNALSVYKDLTLTVQSFVPHDAPVIVQWISIQNTSAQQRTLELTTAVRWVLGSGWT
jgi:cyclic beta-1,2-glucan synthetase